MAAVTFTVREAIAACDVDDITQWNGNTSAERIATDIFDDDFHSCMDITIQDIENDYKTYASLTAAQGQIRLRPNMKKQIKALVQWSRDMIRTGQDPTLERFPVENTARLIRRYKDHESYVKRSENILS